MSGDSGLETAGAVLALTGKAIMQSGAADARGGAVGVVTAARNGLAGMVSAGNPPAGLVCLGSGRSGAVLAGSRVVMGATIAVAGGVMYQAGNLVHRVAIAKRSAHGHL